MIVSVMDALIRDYQDADEQSWLRCRVLGFLDTSCSMFPNHSGGRVSGDTSATGRPVIAAADELASAGRSVEAARTTKQHTQQVGVPPSVVHCAMGVRHEGAPDSGRCGRSSSDAAYSAHKPFLIWFGTL